MSPQSVRHRPARLAMLVALLLGAVGLPSLTAYADTYQPVSGSGSTWSQNALEQWIRNVDQYGIKVQYAGGGSSTGREQFRGSAVDFAISEIPYGVQDGQSYEAPPPRKFAYMPIVAGGTSFMYNLKINGRQVRELRLSGENLTKIFVGAITRWDDPALKADNPGLDLPAREIRPIVRSDGSGTTAQFTAWMLNQHPGIYQQLCDKGRRNPCTQTSNFPDIGMVAKSGSDGVSGFVKQAQNEGSITYVEYSYARNAGFPVVKVLNKAGYYTLPTAQNVAVGLLEARINDDASNPVTYLTQKLEGVYANPDPRAYPLSSYSYMILPTEEDGRMTKEKGKTLGAFAYYFLCDGQQLADDLGYSPLPVNLVQAGFEQIKKIPGAQVEDKRVESCNNPTLGPGGKNALAEKAPAPSACDKQGPTQCGTRLEGGAAAGPGNAGGAGPAANAKGGAAKGQGGVKAGQKIDPKTGKPLAAATQGASPGAAVSQGADGTALGSDGAVASEDELTAGAVGGGAIARPFELASNDGWSRDQAVMALAGLSLLVLTIGPPLIVRRMKGEER